MRIKSIFFENLHVFYHFSQGKVLEKCTDIHEKLILMDKINNFNGFSACGYFTLGKPLLTTIVANILTFMIIIVQFKLSQDKY